MDSRVHRLEKEAYVAVLRAFAAQSKVLSWEKEELMTEIRLHLEISDTQHRKILSDVCSENGIEISRDKRKRADAHQPSAMKQQPPQGSSPQKRLKSTQGDVASRNHQNLMKSASQERGPVRVEKPNKFDVRLGNGNTKGQSDMIKIRSTDKLVHQVENISRRSNPDPVPAKKASLLLKVPNSIDSVSLAARIDGFKSKSKPGTGEGTALLGAVDKLGNLPVDDELKAAVRIPPMSQHNGC